METKIKNFDDLKTMGCVSKSFTVGTHTIKMRSLSYEEQSILVASVPEVENGEKKIKEPRRFDIIQREILATAIDSIDGVVLTGEEKTSLIGESQTPFVNLLFTLYEQLLAEQNQIMDAVKKNISSLVKTP